MASDMFDGFDHTQYREEVEQRWGKQAYGARSDRWWRGLEAAGPTRGVPGRGGLGRSRRDRGCKSAGSRFAGQQRRGAGPGQAARRLDTRISVWGRRDTRRRSSSPGWRRCTWRTSGSRRTTAAPRVRPYVRDAMKVYADRNL